MQDVCVYHDTLVIPTYKMLEDDLNPIFDKLLDPYPYTLQNHRSNEIEERVYDVVILENKYLKLTVIPSLGGRLFSAVDKRTNREFLYRNSVIRPRMIGTRGAWFSGGIEFNFPISHSPTTMDRVNCTTHTYEDGSASIIFGNIEQISSMNWKVELRLYSDKAYIEQNVSLYNPTPRENKFYFWTNTAVEYNESVRLIYPFDWAINFDRNYVKWPYYKGMDCRNPREIPSAFETFGKLMANNFFGIYNFEKDYGLVHYTNRKKVKGAKFFIWGNDDNAKGWNKSLTDDDSQYIEIQSGPFESQYVYKFLRPYQQLSWSEYWYPTLGMKGFKHAEQELAMDFGKIDNGIEFRLLAVEELKNCELILTVNGKQYKSSIDLTPDHVATVTFQVQGDFELYRIKFNVFCGSRHLINLGERSEITDEYPDIDLYEDSRVGILNQDTDKFLKQGQWRESLGLTTDAITYYRKNLEANPCCTITLNRLGNLLLNSMQYEQASECFKKVLVYDNRNSQSRFYLGVAEKEQGNLHRARRLFADIAADCEYFQPSIVELIKLDLKFGYYPEAQALCDLLEKTGNYGLFLSSCSYRKDGLLDRAKQLLDSEEGWADEYILTERYLLYASEKDRDRLLAFTAGDEKSLLPIALDYLDMDFIDDANSVLNLIVNPSVKSKLIHGVIKTLQQNDDSHLLLAVQNESLDYMFFREPKLVQILESILHKDDTGRANYLLGTYYYAVGRRDDALDQYLRAHDKGLRYTTLLHNIGYIYFNYMKNNQLAENYFREDVFVNNGSNEDSLVFLDRIYQESRNLDRRMELIPLMERAYNKSLVLVPLVNLLKDAGYAQKALHLLETEEFENWEGREVSGSCYRDVILHLVQKELEKGNYSQAKQFIDRVRIYPSNLNYGEPANIALPEVYYYEGLICSGLGEEDSAIAAFRKGASEMYKQSCAETGKCKEFSMRCVAELQQRELFS